MSDWIKPIALFLVMTAVGVWEFTENPHFFVIALLIVGGGGMLIGALSSSPNYGEKKSTVRFKGSLLGLFFGSLIVLVVVGIMIFASGGVSSTSPYQRVPPK
jgi:hypothetical protein